jgi:hypothetical protein
MKQASTLVVLDVVDVKRRRLQVDADADEIEVDEEMTNSTLTPEAYVSTVEVPLDFVLIGKCIDIEVVHYPKD